MKNTFKDPVINESLIWNQHINKLQTNWMSVFYETTEVEDEVNWINLFGSEVYDLNSLSMTSLGLSYSDDFEGYFKIAGFSLYRNVNQLKISRQSYGLLSLIGDVGGLLDGLMLLLILLNSIIVGKWRINEYMMERLYVAPETDEIKKDENYGITIDELNKDLKVGDEKVNQLSDQMWNTITNRKPRNQDDFCQKICLKFLCCKMCKKRLKESKDRNERAEKSIVKEFDLNYIVKLLRFHRVLMKAISSQKVRNVSKKLSARYFSASEHDSLAELHSSESSVEEEVYEE